MATLSRAAALRVKHNRESSESDEGKYSLVNSNVYLQVSGYFVPHCCLQPEQFMVLFCFDDLTLMWVFRRLAKMTAGGNNWSVHHPATVSGHLIAASIQHLQEHHLDFFFLSFSSTTFPTPMSGILAVSLKAHRHPEAKVDYRFDLQGH